MYFNKSISNQLVAYAFFHTYNQRILFVKICSKESDFKLFYSFLSLGYLR